MYTDVKISIKLRKVEVEFFQTVGVKQGDKMALVLFLFLMTAFFELLEQEFYTLLHYSEGWIKLQLHMKVNLWKYLKNSNELSFGPKGVKWVHSNHPLYTSQWKSKPDKFDEIFID